MNSLVTIEFKTLSNFLELGDNHIGKLNSAELGVNLFFCISDSV